MKSADWVALQGSLCPSDLQSVQGFARALAKDEPFVFVTNGRLCLALDGPGIARLAEVMLAEWTEAVRPGESRSQESVQ